MKRSNTTVNNSTNEGTIYGIFPRMTESESDVEINHAWLASTVDFIKSQGLSNEVCKESVYTVINHPTFIWATDTMRETFAEDLLSLL